MTAFYTLADCARLLHEPKQTVREWTLKGLAPTRKAGQRFSPAAYNFDDFVSLYVVSELRRRGIPLQTIRAAELWLRETLGHQRPLARASLFSAAKEILVRLTADELPGPLVAASLSGQQAIEEAFDAVLESVEFSDGSAICWRPSAGVEVSPLRQFGAPCIAGTGIQTATIYGFIRAGNEPERIAHLYELPVDRVNSAVVWERKLARAA